MPLIRLIEAFLDQKNVQSMITVVAGALMFLTGTALNIWMFFGNFWPTYLFFLVMAVGGVVMLLGVWASRNWIFRDHPLGIIKRNIAIFAAVFLAGIVTIWATQTDVKHRVSYQMIWRYSDPSTEASSSRHIILTFADYPHHFIEMDSPDVGSYLKSVGTDRVEVIFEITCDFGRVRSYTAVQIGELTNWRSHSGSGGGYPHTPSPWKCKQ